LTDKQLDQIGKIDVLLIPVGGVYTIDGPQAVNIVDQLRPLIVVPIHYKLPVLTIDLNTAEPFLDKLPSSYKRVEAVGNTLAVSRGRRTGQNVKKVVVLNPKPYQLPEGLRKLLDEKEKAAKKSQSLFTSLSINQLNHRPSNGTHTPRWNAEHVMASDLRMFSAVYARLDPMIPRINLNPRQMPPDYIPTHPDWTGVEEARQIERGLALVRRFAYLLEGTALDKKPQGSPRTVQKLFEQITTHYAEHSVNVKKKFFLPDWPKQ
ncbi:MAG: MBL fold metallo-hydrolase, partial [Planctomycetes bacterium]|nr:MBL fold metallo-hydrolase [Planctomycetota bacterium]